MTSYLSRHKNLNEIGIRIFFILLFIFLSFFYLVEIQNLLAAEKKMPSLQECLRSLRENSKIPSKRLPLRERDSGILVFVPERPQEATRGAPSESRRRGLSEDSKDITRSAISRGPVPLNELAPIEERTNNEKSQFFYQVADAIEKNRDSIKKILLHINTIPGAEYELNQVITTLRNAADLELYHLENTKPLNNIAVYGSTNIPLYTLILHAIIPSTIAENIWFRTPQSTREVYRSLFQLLNSIAPHSFLDRIHLLVEPHEVQYDNFRKIYVLGTNRKGNRLERPPSEIVIFTGNPDTGRDILETNRKKLEELSLKVSAPYKQVFLGFGSGMNPVIVTRDSWSNLEAAIQATLDPIRINCSQDCIAPSFYSVDEDIKHPYIHRLLDEISRMKIGSRLDASTGISPLTLSEDLSKLKDYREKYQKYLINPEAIFDTGQKLVSPHLFVFPISMFKEVSLQQHYAPFISIFTYRGIQDLREMARDPRVQRRCMYVSIFGDSKASTEVTEAVNLFQQERHGVSVNSGVYADESGNMAFGGMGADAAIMAILTQNPGESVKIQMGHHPLLFSEEAFSEFGKNTKFSPLLNSHDFYRSQMQAMILSADSKSPHSLQMRYEWEKLKEPNLANLVLTLNGLREEIQKSNLYYVLGEPKPSEEKDLTALKNFYGTGLVFSSDLPKATGHIPHIPGVLIHQSDALDGPSKLNLARGTRNPFLGRGYLMGILDGNKLAEFQLAEAISPGIIPKTETYQDLAKFGIIGSEIDQKRKRLINRLQFYLNRRIPLGISERDETRRSIAELLNDLFSMVRKHFPEGAFFKNYDDFATADLGIQITSFSTNPKRVADQFLMRFESALDEMEGADRLESPYFQNTLLKAHYETGTKFLNQLLINPDPLLIQSRVRIAQTEMGFKKEVRVDFIHGQPVFGRLRYSHEYWPEEIESAINIIRDFFQKAPVEIQQLSGGADIVQLQDGSWKIIEFNFGAASGTLSPKTFPILSNELISLLRGSSTPLIKSLKEIYRKGSSAQREYLLSIKQEKELWNKASLSEISRFEIAKWFRDQYLREWQENPKEDSGAEVLLKLGNLFQDLASPGNDDFENLIRGAKNYIQWKLKDH